MINLVIFLKSCSLGHGKFKVVEEKCGEKKSDLSMVMTNDGV